MHRIDRGARSFASEPHRRAGGVEAPGNGPGEIPVREYTLMTTRSTPMFHPGCRNERASDSAHRFPRHVLPSPRIGSFSNFYRRKPSRAKATCDDIRLGRKLHRLGCGSEGRVDDGVHPGGHRARRRVVPWWRSRVASRGVGPFDFRVDQTRHAQRPDSSNEQGSASSSLQ